MLLAVSPVLLARAHQIGSAISASLKMLLTPPLLSEICSLQVAALLAGCRCPLASCALAPC